MTPSATAARARRFFAFAFEPPGTTPSATRRRACESSGTLPTEISAVVPEAAIISYVCPSRPKPVTSVTAWIVKPSIASIAARLSVHITATASSSAASDRRRGEGAAADDDVRDAESDRPARIVTPIPSGFVRTSASPGRAPAFRVTRDSSTTPVTERP